MPTLILIGGANGAGKTTFARSYLTREMKGFRFLNADEIARGLSPFDVESVAFKAGRLLLSEVREEISTGKNFALESTLSGRTHAKILKEAKAAGYEIHLHFLWIPSAKVSRERVDNRVKHGGHNVLTKDLDRRYPKIAQNLINLYLPLVDVWKLYNSAHDPPKILAENKTHATPSVDSSLMIESKKIDLIGLSQKEMSETSRIALKAMQRGLREAKKEYKRLGLLMVTTDKQGNIVHKKP